MNNDLKKIEEKQNKIFAAKELEMQWLIALHLDNKIIYEINETRRAHGGITKPTGVGKSSLIYNDIIYRIVHRRANKQIFNISTPIINLAEQQGKRLIQVIEGVADHYGINRNEIIYFINNSGKTQTYNKEMKYSDSSLESFNSFKYKFENNPQKRVAIVINCHPSLSSKMISWLKKNDTRKYDIATYIDEAHTITVKITNKDNENDTKIDLSTLCEKSNVYLISATNKQEIVKLVNKFDGEENDKPIIIETPAEAIKLNKICLPKIHYIRTETGEITHTICIKFMNDVKYDNPSIFHKILITCKDTKHLKGLKKQLKDRGYTVFSTCNNEGMIGLENVELENTNHSFSNITDFINAIHNCTTDCFVLHIKQMISGIDVDCLTDGIIQRNNTNDFNTYDTTVQIIGRLLRLGNEREKNYDERNKKYANVLFVTNAQNETIHNDLDKFMTEYYGRGMFEFHDINSGTSYNKNKEDLDLDNEILNIRHTDNVIDYWEDLKLNIEEYIKEKVVPLFNGYKQLGIQIDVEIMAEIERIEKRHKENLNNVYLLKYIRNVDLRNDIEKLIRKYV